MVPLVLALIAIQAGEPSCRSAESRVEELISSKAAELRADEYCQFRRYHTLDDVDGDEQDDFIVVFALEGLGGGGNNHVQYLAVFLSASSWKPAVVEVGQRGVRNVTEVSLDQGVIVLTTAEQRRDDALCCPSGKGELRYRLKAGQLLKASTGRPPMR